MLSRHDLALLDIVLNVPEMLLKVVQSLKRSGDFLLFRLKFVHCWTSETKHFGTIHGLLSVIHLFACVLELLRNALFAEWSVFEHHDWLWEVNLTQVHLDSICVKRHLRTSSVLLALFHLF